MSDSIPRRQEADFKEQLSQNAKIIAFFLLFVLGVGAVLATLVVLNNGAILRALHTIGFLFLGILQTRLYIGALDFFNERQQFFHTAISALVLLVFLCIAHTLFPGYSWLQMVSAVSAFLLPFTIQQLWHLFQLFSFTSGKTWTYSGDLPLQKSTTFLNSIPVKFKVQLEDGNLQYQVNFRAPVRMKLGLLFYHMVQNQQASGKVPIRLVDEQNDPYTWVFQASRFGFTRILDPEASLLENGIRKNTSVIARQIKTGEHS